MLAVRAFSSVVLLGLVACGGSSTGPTSNSSTNSCSTPLSAIVNGVAWCSPLPQVSSSSTIVSIAGFDSGITSAIAVAAAATTTGTYSLAFGNSTGGFATYAKGSQGWSSGLSGGTGSITITTRTANHIVGTFSFTAVPSNGGATGTIQVTNGKIDITF
jgi:Family of unknown function (DUF6252)